MTSKEFTMWLHGFMDAVDGVPTQTQWDIIKNKLSNVGDSITLPISGPTIISDPNIFPKWQEPHKVNPYIGGKTDTKVMYGDICSCNPKNGGSGICGCVMAHELVDPTLYGKTNITTTDTITVSSTPYGSWQTTSTGKMPDNVTLTYNTNSSKELLKD